MLKIILSHWWIGRAVAMVRSKKKTIERQIRTNLCWSASKKASQRRGSALRPLCSWTHSMSKLYLFRNIYDLNEEQELYMYMQTTCSFVFEGPSCFRWGRELTNIFSGLFFQMTFSRKKRNQPWGMSLCSSWLCGIWRHWMRPVFGTNVRSPYRHVNRLSTLNRYD